MRGLDGIDQRIEMRQDRLGANAAAARDPAKRPLLDKKEALEESIEKLKFEKAAMPAQVYKRRLTQLLLELARTQEALDK